MSGGKERSSDTFFAGLLSGWYVFGERNAVNEQVRPVALISSIKHPKCSPVLASARADRPVRRVARCHELPPSGRPPVAAERAAASLRRRLALDSPPATWCAVRSPKTARLTRLRPLRCRHLGCGHVPLQGAQGYSAGRHGQQHAGDPFPVYALSKSKRAHVARFTVPVRRLGGVVQPAEPRLACVAFLRAHHTHNTDLFSNHRQPVGPDFDDIASSIKREGQAGRCPCPRPRWRDTIRLLNFCMLQMCTLVASNLEVPAVGRITCVDAGTSAEQFCECLSLLGDVSGGYTTASCFKSQYGGCRI